MKTPGIHDSIKSEKRIRSYVRKTPFNKSIFFSELIHASVWFKLENLQITGSFKVRGALNKLLSLSSDQRANGVISASTGNHGAAVAYGSGKLGIQSTIYVPHDTSQSKLEKMELFGAKIEYFGDDCIQCESKARDISDKTSQAYISPYNDPFVVAGQGTIGVEIENQSNRLDVLIVSVGGGGLISGISSYLKSIWPNLYVIGCSPENSAIMVHSMKAGKILDLESKPTISDGTAGGVEKDSITFPLCSQNIDETVIVTEQEIRKAMVLYMQHEHQLLEGSAGVAIASMVKKKDDLIGKRVGIVICGGNISLEKLKGVI
ncbi:MAG: serine/threonine dehydratase [Candidatus Marinimicrobia bacterium]|nr:serine/threonine dehydratase [Candidatus Neomarinimicrobiota bacterium]|tara:strand:- start:341 stop:1297 length:957 start_codon:yes stop_codon:yes gene_type:complete